jgi:hypothetical protein
MLIALAALGACLFVAGVALISPPAALMAAGVLLIAAAHLIAEERDS